MPTKEKKTISYSYAQMAVRMANMQPERTNRTLKLSEILKHNI
jgi:hypothetical protein